MSAQGRAKPRSAALGYAMSWSLRRTGRHENQMVGGGLVNCGLLRASQMFRPSRARRVSWPVYPGRRWFLVS